MRDLVLNTMLGPSGLSRAGQEFYKCLSKAGLRVVPFWLVPHHDDVIYIDQVLRQEMESAAALLVGSSPIQFHVGMTSGVKLLKDRSMLIGSIVQEGPAISPNQAAPLAAMDIVTAPSWFCRNSLLSAGVPRNKVEYLPYPLDLDKWNENIRGLMPRMGRTRFLFMNTAYERKGIDILIKAWLEEFSSDDPVELVFKSHRENTRLTPVREMIDRTAKSIRVNPIQRAPISVIDEPLHDKDIPGFMASFDAYVSPHRAEGFGMNPWHAMALGVPVICTQYGGVMDFANPDTASMIAVEKIGKPSASELANIPMLEGVAWAEPSIDSLRRSMREVLKDPIAAKQRAANGLKLVKEKYAYDVISNMFSSILEQRRPGLWDELCAGKGFNVNLPIRFVSEEKPVNFFEL